MIRRGSTPTYTVTISSSDPSVSIATIIAAIEDIFITFEQEGVSEITKHGDDLTWGEDSVSFYLTQQDTLSFEEGSIEIQIRVALPNDMAMGTDIAADTVGRVLYEEVI